MNQPELILMDSDIDGATSLLFLSKQPTFRRE